MTSVFKRVFVAGLWLVLFFGAVEVNAACSQFVVTGPNTKVDDTKAEIMVSGDTSEFKVWGYQCASNNGSWTDLTTGSSFGWSWSWYSNGANAQNSNSLTAPNVTSITSARVYVIYSNTTYASRKVTIEPKPVSVTFDHIRGGVDPDVGAVYSDSRFKNNVRYVNKEAVTFYMKAVDSIGGETTVTNSTSWAFTCLDKSLDTPLDDCGNNGVSISGSTVNFSNIPENVRYKVTGTYTPSGGSAVKEEWVVVARSKLPDFDAITLNTPPVVEGLPEVFDNTVDAWQFSLKLNWVGGGTADVIPDSGWEVTPQSGASIVSGGTNSGLLSTSDIDADQVVTVKLVNHILPDYPERSLGFTADVRIRNKVVLERLEIRDVTGENVISGAGGLPNSVLVPVNEGEGMPFSAFAIFTDGSVYSEDDVTSISERTTWEVVSGNGSIAAGDYTTGSVPRDGLPHEVVIKATYDDGNNPAQSAQVAIDVLDTTPLIGVNIVGPEVTTFNEGVAYKYSVTAIFEEDFVQTQDSFVDANWTIDSAYISSVVENVGGEHSIVLTPTGLLRDQVANLTASYTYAGVTQSQTFSVGLNDDFSGVVELLIDGVDAVSENGNAIFSARAIYDDGSEVVVSPEWNENSAFASVDATGLLTAGDVTADQPFELSAKYSVGNDTVYAKRHLTLVDTDSNAGITSRVSVDSNEVEANAVSGSAAISNDGQYVAFDSMASNLIVGQADSDGVSDVFVRDIASGTTELVSVAEGGVQTGGVSRNPSISRKLTGSNDNLWVAFESEVNGVSHIFVRDVSAGSTEHVTNIVTGVADGASVNPTISADGRYVVFESDATNLVVDDVNGVTDVFLFDRNTQETFILEVGGFRANGASHTAVISNYGAFIAFSSAATNLTFGDDNGYSDIFVLESVDGSVKRISVDTQGNDLVGDAVNPSISGDGRYVAFELRVVDHLTGVWTGSSAVYIRDTLTGITTRLASQLANEGEASAASYRAPSISFDGRMVAFEHYVSDADSPSNGAWSVSVFDRETETVRHLALNSDGIAANDESFNPVLNSDGSMFAFTSSADNMLVGMVDGNLAADVFSRQLVQPAIKVNKLSLLPAAPAVLASEPVVVDLMMDFDTDATLGGGLELLYDNSLLQYESFELNPALNDDPAYRAGIAPVVNSDGSLKNGILSFGHFDGLSGSQKVGTITFTPSSAAAVGIAYVSLLNNAAPYGDFYGAASYVGQPVKYEDTTVSIGVDTDGDGVVDSLDAFPDNISEWADTDGDGLGDNYELQNDMDPNNQDTDGDGIIDSVEVALGTDPTSNDTDGDTILDSDELGLGLDPTMEDSDGDGVNDNIDAFPADDTDLYVDTDGDGIININEYQWGSDPSVDNTGSGDSDINKSWVKIVGGNGYDAANQTVVDNQGNVYIIGSYSGEVSFDGVTAPVPANGGTDIFVSKYMANGAYLWTKVIGGSGYDYGTSLAVDSTGNVFIFGVFEGLVDFNPGTGVSDVAELTATIDSEVFVTKLTSDGDYVWAQQLPGTDDSPWGRNIAVDAVGNVYVTALDQDPYVAKLDGLSGLPVWPAYHYVVTTGNGGDEAHGIVLDASGNVYVSGTLGGATDFLAEPGGSGSYFRNAFLMRLDPNDGSRVWVGAIEAQSEAEALEIRGGYVYVGGNFSGIVNFGSTGVIDKHQSGSYRGFVAKFDLDGNYVWSRALGDYVYGIGVASNDDVYVSGDFYGASLFDSIGKTDSYTIGLNAGAFITKFLSNGDYVWTEVLTGTDGNGFAHVNSLSINANDEIYLAGSFQGDLDLDLTDALDVRNSKTFGSDSFLLKLQDDVPFTTPGVHVYNWTQSHGGASVEFGKDVVADSLGNTYVVGSFYGSADFYPGDPIETHISAGQSDIFISRRNADDINTNDNYVWTRTFGGTGYDEAYSVAVDEENSVYITGYFSGSVNFDPDDDLTDSLRISKGGSRDVYVLKLDDLGKFVWVRTFGGIYHDYGHDIAIDGSNIYVTGEFKHSVTIGNYPSIVSKGSTDVFVAELSTNGDYAEPRSFGGSGGDRGLIISVDTFGDILVGGVMRGSVDFDPQGVGDTKIGDSLFYNAFLTKLYSSGGYAWTKLVTGTGASSGNAITLDPVGNIYFSGTFEGSSGFNPNNLTELRDSTGNNDDGFISKYDVDGNYSWTQFVESSESVDIKDLVANFQGVFAVGSFTGAADFNPSHQDIGSRTSIGSNDVFVLHLLADDGGYGWAKTVGGQYNDIARGAALDGDMNLFVVGDFSNGNISSSVDFNPNASGWDYHTAVFSSDVFLSKYDFLLDSDGDGVADVSDLFPSDASESIDTDGDGIGNNSDPDNDNDGMPNDWEIQYGLDPLLESDAGLDKDEDSLINILEYQNNTNPELPDTEPDGMPDYWEIQYGLDPTIDDSLSDPDGDGANNLLEYEQGRDPKFPDGSISGLHEYVWTQSNGGDASDYGYDVTTDDLGNVYIAGSFGGSVDFDSGGGFDPKPSIGGMDIFVSKRNANGSNAWTRTFGGTGADEAYAVDVDAEGSVYVAGYVFSGSIDFDPDNAATDSYRVSKGATDAYVVKLDALGNFVWVHYFGGSSSDYARDLVVDSGNVYITGSFYSNVDFGGGNFLSSKGNGDVFVLQLTKAGDFGWARTFGNRSSDSGASIAVNSAGSIFVAGSVVGTVDFDPLGTGDIQTTYTSYFMDSFLSKINPDGGYAWTRLVGGASQDYGSSVATDGLSVYLSGIFKETSYFGPGLDSRTSAGGYDVFVSKFNSEGDYSWTKALGGTGDDRVSGLVADNQGVYLSGKFVGTVDFNSSADFDQQTAFAADDAFIMRLYGDGGYGWAKTVGGQYNDIARGLALDSNNNLFVVGDYALGNTSTVNNRTVDFDPSSKEDNHTAVLRNDVFLSKYDFLLDSDGDGVPDVRDAYEFDDTQW